MSIDNEKEQINNEDVESNIDSNISLDSTELESNENNDEDGEIKDHKDLKIKELEEKYIRAYADFENIKKRLEREKYQSLEYANEGILKDFIPILDTLESAMGGFDENMDSKEVVSNIQEGIRLTIDNFLKALHKNGVELIDTNCEFDPNLHNAIMQVKDDNKENGSISQVIQKGYKYKDRVVRPSMVSITKND